VWWSDPTARRIADAQRSPVRRAVNAAILLVLFGTCGFMWLEGWDFGKAFFFTIITVTTVGYGDYGLSEEGLRFATILIVCGFGVVTYAAGQLAPIILNERVAREWKMKRELRKLSGHFIVCGLGRVGRAVCANLAQEHLPFVAVDPDEAAVEEAARSGYLAVRGDATSDDVLVRLGVERARCIACVTDSDTDNIVITLSARHLSASVFIISRAEDEGTIRKISRAGASRVISPIRAGGSNIANAMVKPNLAELLDRSNDLESGIALAEVAVSDTSPLAGRSIRDCGSDHGSVVFVALVHPDEQARFRPDVDESLGAGDVLIVAGDALAVGRLQDDAKGRRLAA
jgi:voltage-gated potassium channel